MNSSGYRSELEAARMRIAHLEAMLDRSRCGKRSPRLAWAVALGSALGTIGGFVLGAGYAEWSIVASKPCERFMCSAFSAR